MCAVERYTMDNIEAFVRRTEVTAAAAIAAVPHPHPGLISAAGGLCPPGPLLTLPPFSDSLRMRSRR